ncbi:YjbF family lipoprotein [Planktotalea sp.]|uniref:YjbF family lipoprotein n=1 Tax=Planktotalea sp. TaxID=2029877 RepID=UPI003D6A3139
MIRFSIALLLSLAVAGCGSERSGISGVAFGALKDAFSRNKQPPLTTAILRSRLTPEVRAELGGPLLIMELPKQKVAAVVVYSTQNGGHVTWLAPDRTAVYTKGGVLTGTRGVGFDLMSSHVDGPLSIITGSGTGLATRVQNYLDGENQEVSIRFECQYVGSKLYVSETCEAKDLKIENHYWLNKDRTIQSSRQWVGERNGYMLIESPIFAD